MSDGPTGVDLTLYGKPVTVRNLRELRKVAPTRTDRACILVESGLVHKTGPGLYFVGSLTWAISGKGEEGYEVDTHYVTCKCLDFQREPRCQHIIAVDTFRIVWGGRGNCQQD